MECIYLSCQSLCNLHFTFICEGYQYIIILIFLCQQIFIMSVDKSLDCMHITMVRWNTLDMTIFIMQCLLSLCSLHLILCRFYCLVSIPVDAFSPILTAVDSTVKCCVPSWMLFKATTSLSPTTVDTGLPFTE